MPRAARDFIFTMRKEAYFSMKKRTGILFALAVALVSFVLVSCGAKAPAWADEAKFSGLAEGVVDTFNGGDLDAVATAFGTQDVTADMFTTSYTTVQGYGAFDSFGDATFTGGKDKSGTEYVTVILPAQYANGKATFTVSFYEDGTLCGFFMK